MTSAVTPAVKPPPVDPTDDSKRWWILALVASAELFGMTLWFTASAVAPFLSERWQLTASEAGGLTTAVQLGFVVGTATAALLNLADLVSARWYVAISATAAALANAALLGVDALGPALVLRFATGFFLAGVYPPSMKMIATWFQDHRGFAIGTLVGALTVGKATPYLIRAIPGSGLTGVVLTASAGALLAAFMVLAGYRDGPYRFERRPFSWGLVGSVWKHRPTRLATYGYLGHMWELYAMWTWIPAFLAASVAARGDAGGTAAADLVAFGAIAAGGLGCLWGGRMADRMGRGPLVIRVLIASGLCSVLVGFFFEAPLLVLAPLTWIWGFFVVADSAQFSAMVTEVAPRHAVGTALTLQTSLGFLLSTVTIQVVPLLVDAFGWRWAFLILALGPIAGIAAIRQLRDQQ